VSESHVWVASADEAGEVARLLIGFRDDLGYESPSDQVFIDGVAKLIADDSTDYLLGAIGDGPAAGICQLRFRFGLWQAGTDCLLEDLFIEQPARGSGLGKAMTQFAVEHATGRGCRRIELDVNEANEPALKLYESLGFGIKSGHGGRDLYLRRNLGADA
jgi:ribosomal protein S18 acetylase RimI-like enzyme